VTLAAVALDAGFTDQSHFTRVFTRLVGVTPAAFRREQRRSAP
jgi:AraC-like DNA-binding protein